MAIELATRPDDDGPEATCYRALEQVWRDAGWPGIGDVTYRPDGSCIWHGADGCEVTYSAQEAGE